MTAKKIITDLSPAHMQARTVLRQLNNHLQALGNSTTGGIFLPGPPTFSGQERHLIGRWKAYLKWEGGNPLELEDKDRATLVARVGHAYRKAVICLRYYPEIWFMAFTWCTSVGQTAEAQSFLRSGLEANPDSFVLTYAEYAELLEKAELKKDQRDFSAVHAVYERFIASLRQNLARLTELDAEADIAANKTSEEPKDQNGILDNTSKSTTAPPPPYNPYKPELADRNRQFSSAWINYMRFARRSQGQTTCRDTFSKARKDMYIGWEAYEAAALMEYRCNAEDGRLVASRIFESGMKKFGTDASYVLAHLSFLLTVNDENNARALFERVIGTFLPADAKPIWECWSRSQYQYDDLEAVLEIQRRMTETYPNDAPIKRFAQRHTYNLIDAIADHDLGFEKTRKTATANLGTYASNPSYPAGGGPLVASHGQAGVKTSVDTPGPAPIIPNPNKRPPPPSDRKPTDYKRARPEDRERRRSPPPPARLDPPKEKKPVVLPTMLNWFVTQLPPRETFDGPVFNTDNLMSTLRTTVIPSSKNRVRLPPPAPPPSTSAVPGRPPLDYGPHQGPQSGFPRERRY